MMALVHYLRGFLLGLDCPVLFHAPSDLHHVHRVHPNSVHVGVGDEPAPG